LARFRSSSALALADSAGRDFALKSNHSVIISVWGTYGPTIVQYHEGERESYLFVRPGRVQRLLNSASGRIFLAFMPQATIKTIVDKELAEKVPGPAVAPASWKAVEALRKEIGRLGYSALANNPMQGMSAIAVPIFDHTRRLICSVSHFDLSSRMDLKKGSSDVSSIVQLSQSVSYQLGYQA
jgi:DNA-binding IclR family transcriptional regulator